MGDFGAGFWGPLVGALAGLLVAGGAWLRSRAKALELSAQVKAEDERAEIAREAALQQAVLSRLDALDVRTKSLETQLDAERERTRELTAEVASLRTQVNMERSLREQAERRAEALAKELAEVRRDLATMGSDPPPVRKR